MPEEEPEPEQEEMEQGETASPPHAAEPSFLIQLDEADARINLISMVCISLSCLKLPSPLYCPIAEHLG